MINILIAVKSHFWDVESTGDDAKLVCNHLNLQTNIVFRIVSPLNKVRFILSEDFTHHLCIINGDGFDLSSFRKLDAGDIKNFYRLYLNTLKLVKKYKLFKNKLDSI
jgi:hypothetical protein